METRTILQIVLGVVGVTIVGLGGVIAYELMREPPTVVDRSVATAEETEPVEKNPWEGRGDEAIALVKKQGVEGIDESTRELVGLESEPSDEHGAEDGDEKGDGGAGSSVTIEQLLGAKKFVESKLKRDPEQAAGWRAVWWGETKYGATYYRVMYAFESGQVEVGPTWVVDLEGETVKPKNVAAQVLSNPSEGVESEYYDKFQEVVSAMSKHTFDSGLSLAGTVLVYFERRSRDQKDTILGWTIQHERGPMYRAYFQWRTEDGANYAEYEFDYDKRALKAVNLHAANIMKVGEQFDHAEPVNILPGSYDPDGRTVASRWTGRARKLYRRRPDKRPIFRALDKVVHDSDRISAIEWLLTAQAKTPAQFEACKKERKCRWKTERKEDGHFRVTYSFDLGDGEETIDWKVYPDEERIEPASRVSKLASRVIHAR